MVLRSLFLGLLFSVSIFGIKSALGLHYFFNRHKKPAVCAGVYLLFSAVYGGLFTAAFVLLQRVDFTAHFQTVQRIMQHGMQGHLAIAVLMGAWGLALLKASGNRGVRQLGWLALATPCPVCLVVIVFSIALLKAYFQDTASLAVGGLYACFLLLNILTLFLMKRLDRYSDYSPERVLGSAMLVIAAYFLISVTVMPQFADLDKIYRLALYSGQKGPSRGNSLWLSATLLMTAFLVGYFKFQYTTRKGTPWNSERV